MSRAVPLRRALAWISAAVTTLVAVAFLVPLTVLVGDTVRERALAEAFRSAAAAGSVLAVTRTPDAVAALIDAAPRRAEEPLAVHLPVPGRGAAPAQVERVVGATAAPPADVLRAMRTGVATAVPVDGGVAVLQPVALAGGLVGVVEVTVPDRLLHRGVPLARAVLVGLAVVLVLASVALADRLASRVVRAAARLRTASGRLGAGDLDVRLIPEGPEELQEAALAFNAMADRVGDLLAAERELVADLSHRLRTPLTGLVLVGRSLGPGLAGDQVRALTARLESEVDAIIREARSKRAAAPSDVARSDVARSDVARPGAAGQAGSGCEAGTVLRERLDFWGALAEDQGRAWSLELPPVPVTVPVATADLRAVVDALLGNVFLHTPEGCAFAVTLRTEGARAVVVVEDAGGGIPDPEAAVRRGISGAGSSGLGLDIVQRVAQVCSGRLLIATSPTLGGAAVTLELGPPPAPPARRRSRRATRAGRR